MDVYCVMTVVHACNVSVITMLMQAHAPLVNPLAIVFIVYHKVSVLNASYHIMWLILAVVIHVLTNAYFVIVQTVMHVLVVTTYHREYVRFVWALVYTVRTQLHASPAWVDIILMVPNVHNAHKLVMFVMTVVNA